MSTLLHLPSEILINIFSHLPLQSTLDLLLSCKKVKGIYDSSPLLQYLAELEVAGMVDNPHCPLGIVEKRLLLQKREAAWGNLEPQSKSTVPLNTDFTGLYDVSSSAFLLGVPCADGIHQACIRTMDFTSTLQDGIPRSPRHSELMLQHTPIDIGVSIEENDLVVVLVGMSAQQLALLFVHHSTKERHSLAQCPLIPVPHAGLLQDTGIEICGDSLVLSMTTRGGAAVLRAYDWKQGILKGTNFVEDTQGIVFLTDELFLTPNAVTHTLDTFYIPPFPTNNHTELKCILKLSLPPQVSPASRIQTRCKPNPTASSLFPRYSSRGKPFIYDADRAIATFTIHPIEVDPEPAFPGHLPDRTSESPMSLFTRRSDLLALLPSYWKEALQPHKHVIDNGASEHELGSPSLTIGGWQQWCSQDLSMDENDDTTCATHSLFGVVSWDTWGPSSTRFLSLFPPSASPSGFVTSTSGERFVFNRRVENSLLDDEPERSRAVLTVIDLNRYRVQRSIMGLSPPSRVSVFYDPPKGFGGDTKMPMMILQDTQMDDHTEIIVDEERIISLHGWDYDNDPMRIDQLVVSHFG